jgi:hypothetical protein
MEESALRHSLKARPTSEIQTHRTILFGPTAERLQRESPDEVTDSIDGQRARFRVLDPKPL